MDESLKSPVDFDAGGMGCGELLIVLKQRLSAMPPHAVLKLTALDPGAVEDIPSWCQMTGHTLREAKHPHYLIERRA